MAANSPLPISIHGALDSLNFLADRRPTTSDEDARDAFRELSGYRDGAIFVGHWAGESEWERHAAGDEIVMAIEGSTTVFFLTVDGERSAHLPAGHLVVVPQGTWHRFETPEAVKLLSVTPQPTDHSSHRPS